MAELLAGCGCDAMTGWVLAQPAAEQFCVALGGQFLTRTAVPGCDLTNLLYAWPSLRRLPPSPGQ